MVAFAVAQFCPVRRALVILLAVLTMAAALSVVTGSPADAAPSVDKRLGQGECALTGRVWVAGRGCARHYCVKGATMFKEGHDAELCRLPGRNGAEFARPINSRRCEDLGRVWIGEVNSCASNPNRARYVVPNAPQCRGNGKIYVNHGEQEGRYDECLTPGRAAKLNKIAKRNKQSLNEAALDRNRFNCSYRAGWVMAQGTCVKREGPVPASQQGGFYMVGDSVSWRADDELAGRERNWILDLRPGRRLDELPGRLDWFRANHGPGDHPARHQPAERVQRGRLPRHDAVAAGQHPGAVPAALPEVQGRQRRPGRGDQEVHPLDAGAGLPASDDLPVGLAEDRGVAPVLPGRRRAPRRPARGLVRALRRPRLE
jgi:hypothetical protein